ncbi:MAG: DNA gyrase subunit A, partial [Candidatus Nanoarchaeia archaeon]
MAEEEKAKRVVEAEISGEMRKAYIDYAMSVIVSRALPSVEDGLKPVHRRILWAMHNMGLQANKQTKKCARIVGDTMGRYHPHGNIALYDALVRMAQSFSLRYPLIFGQGNFGSLDGDPPAADRYTEAKMTKISNELLQDIEKKTVNMRMNFDNTLEEPVVLPGKLPNLLLNGASGIAVGMTTNIPPHNINDVCDTILTYIDKPSSTSEELMSVLKAPDFPTGGRLTGELKEMYTKGKGKLVIRGRTKIE